MKERQTAFQVRHLIVVGGLIGPWLAVCSPESDLSAQRSDRTSTKPDFVQKGEASWYGPGFHGQETAARRAKRPKASPDRKGNQK